LIDKGDLFMKIAKLLLSVITVCAVMRVAYGVKATKFNHTIYVTNVSGATNGAAVAGTVTIAGSALVFVTFSPGVPAVLHTFTKADQ
jgi:hypothetical protein